MLQSLPFPGEGRGPVGSVILADAALRDLDLANWTPAFAVEAIIEEEIARG